MPLSDNFLNLACELIGVRGVYQEQEYIIVEILLDSAAVVLEPMSQTSHIQSDFQGEARRYAPKHFTVPLLSEVQRTLHPVLVQFLGKDIVSVLNDSLEKN